MDYYSIKLVDVHRCITTKYEYVHSLNEDFDDQIPFMCAELMDFDELRHSEVDELMNYVFWTLGGWIHNKTSEGRFLTAMKKIDDALKEKGTSIQKEINNC